MKNPLTFHPESFFNINKSETNLIMKYIIWTALIFFNFYVTGQTIPKSPASDTTLTKQTFDTISLSDYEFVVREDKLYLKSPGIGRYLLSINNEQFILADSAGLLRFPHEINASGKLFLCKTEKRYSIYHISFDNQTFRVKSVPFFLSVFPPLVAILCALIFKEVLFSLFLGIWAGVFILGGMRMDSMYYFLLSVWDVIAKFVILSLTDKGHISIIVFSMLIGGMVALISKNGGMSGVVHKLSRYAKDNKSSQLITWLLGIVVFFDDYANTLVVGNTMRPVTDKFRISREKLSYLVDSTAAPVAAVAFITTWIGAQLAYIQSGMETIPGGSSVSPYHLYFSSLQYAFYPFLTIGFMLLLILTRRDYGPMYHAEVRARKGFVTSKEQQSEDEPDMEDLKPVKGARQHWAKAAFPVLTVIIVTIFSLLETGFTALHSQSFPEGTINSWSVLWHELDVILPEGEKGFFMKLGKVIGSADSYISLLWASISGLFVAMILTLADKSMKLFNMMHWVTVGFKTMLPALLILILAWSLAEVTGELHTATFISQAIAGNIPPFLMPSLIFILSFLIAFSTGSSWSTMAILYPIALPATFAVCADAGLDFEQTMPYLVHVISVVLAAAVFGDHCSPISDTTILSSLASDCNHLDHVKTQMPYAMTVGLVSLLLSFVSAWLNASALLNFGLFAIGTFALYIIIIYFGKKVEEVG